MIHGPREEETPSRAHHCWCIPWPCAPEAHCSVEARPACAMDLRWAADALARHLVCGCCDDGDTVALGLCFAVAHLTVQDTAKMSIYTADLLPLLQEAGACQLAAGFSSALEGVRPLGHPFCVLYGFSSAVACQRCFGSTAYRTAALGGVEWGHLRHADREQISESPQLMGSPPHIWPPQPMASPHPKVSPPHVGSPVYVGSLPAMAPPPMGPPPPRGSPQLMASPHPLRSSEATVSPQPIAAQSAAAHGIGEARRSLWDRCPCDRRSPCYHRDQMDCRRLWDHRTHFGCYVAARAYSIAGTQRRSWGH